jgi:hypothetical protein
MPSDGLLCQAMMAFMPSDGLLCQAKMGFSQFVMIVHVAHVVSIV